MRRARSKGRITLKQILNTINFSEKKDWEMFFRGNKEVPPGYDQMASYKPDRSISLAWGWLLKKILTKIGLISGLIRSHRVVI
jgi:hypothetical protein